MSKLGLAGKGKGKYHKIRGGEKAGSNEAERLWNLSEIRTPGPDGPGRAEGGSRRTGG